MGKAWMVLAPLVASMASAGPVALATPTGPLASLTSAGQLGDISSLLSPSSVPFLLNTDTGQLGDLGGQGGTFVGHTTLPFQTVAQPGGPSVSVFDFSSFSLNAGITLIIAGSQPAA